VKGGWASIEDLLHELWDGSTSRPIFRQLCNLLGRWDLAGEEKPKEALRERLVATGGFWEKLLAFRNGLATETDTLVCSYELNSRTEGDDTYQHQVRNLPR
jgi:hypothetical protein